MNLKPLNKKSIILLLILGLLSIPLLMHSSKTTIAYSLDQIDNENRLSYSPQRGAIEILNDTALAAFSLGDGTGESNNPYVINDYNISANSENGIYVTGTTKYFVIEYNYIILVDICIFIDSVPSGTALIANNIMGEASIGIYLQNTPNILISDNTCLDFSDNAIKLEYSPHCEILDNTCQWAWDGIVLLFSSDCTIDGNTIYTSYNNGLVLHKSESAWISYNTITLSTDNGIFIDDLCNYTTVTQNNVDNNWVGIITDRSDDLTITRNSLNNNGGEGLYLLNSNYLLVTHNEIDNSDTAILLYYCENGTISNNICEGSAIGIFLHRVIFSEIHNNLLFENSGYGVQIYEFCSFNVIHHNAFVGNNDGGTSQASDIGVDNKWYHEGTSEGNYWDEWISGIYEVDGIGGDDLYPLNYMSVISEFTINYLLLIMSIFSIISIIYIISRKQSKK